ncbi:uncharacterized protein [Symphalangus syndactylus]|uniref:uncharacterized protein isoform X3 n=1 Tax=Symphalangus syndactylus TaxID=9590 RepID=UPI0030071834
MVRGGDKQAARKSSLRKSGSRTLREARKPLPSPAHPTCPSPKPSPQPLPTTTSSHRAPPANTGPGPPSLRSSQIRTPLEARRRGHDQQPVLSSRVLTPACSVQRLGSKMTRWRLRRDQAPGEGTQAKLLGLCFSLLSLQPLRDSLPGPATPLLRTVEPGPALGGPTLTSRPSLAGPPPCGRLHLTCPHSPIRNKQSVPGGAGPDCP